MSVRYTGVATMEGPALRDVEHWKDKIEVRLDNRQVFFLFFGSALVACMLFVLGVLVGKRLETRGRAEAPVVDDPLAVLDRFRGPLPDEGPSDALTFPRNLIVPTAGAARGGSRSKLGKPGGASKDGMTGSSGKIGMTGARDDREPAPARENRLAAKAVLTAGSLAASDAPAVPMVSRRPDATTRSEARQGSGAASSEKLPAVASNGGDPTTTGEPAAEAARSLASGADEGRVAEGASPGVPPAPSPRARGHFLLQVSAFEDKAEADAFARRLAAEDATVVPTEMPGKGTWYRVRVGSYSTLKEASSAKAAFERQHHLIAYVAGTGPAR